VAPHLNICGSITHLKANYCSVTALNVAQLAPCFPLIVNIGMAGSSMNDAALEILALTCKHLRYVNIVMIIGSCWDIYYSWLFKINVPNQLNSDNETISENYFWHQTYLCMWRVLDVSDCLSLTDRGVEQFCRHAPQIQVLKLSQLQSKNARYAFTKPLFERNRTINGFCLIIRLKGEDVIQYTDQVIMWPY